MTRSVESTLGALTAVPLLVSVYIMIRVLQLVLEIESAGASIGPEPLNSAMAEVGVATVISGLVTVGLLGFFLWHVLVRRARRDPTQQALWAILLLVFSVITLPIYWFLFIWPEAPDGAEPRLRDA